MRVTIFCEGKNTEPEYFKAFAAEYGNRLVAVKPIGAAGSPSAIVTKAIEAKRFTERHPRDTFEKNDQVWAAFDHDGRSEVGNCLKLAERSGIRVAYSNPCFELWAILHFMNHDAPVTSAEAQRLLQRLCRRYDPKGDKRLDYDALRSGYEPACRRAEAMRRRREEEGAAQGCPYTDVHVLTGIIVVNGKRKP